MLSWPTNPVIASIFAALPFSELARVLVRLDQAESASREVLGNHR
jgi:hypothetical protein